MKWYEAGSPGRNARCPCDSGKKTKHCCENLFRATVPGDVEDAGVYLCWSDLWPVGQVDRATLATQVAPLDASWLSQLLARINWYLGDSVFGATTPLELQLFDEFSDAVTARKVRAWIESGKRQKVAHRTTLLAYQQMNLLAGPRSGRAGDDGALREAVELIPKVNDVLDDDYEERAWAEADAKGVDLSLAGHFYRTSFYSHKPTFGTAFGRYWALLVHGLSQVATKEAHAAFPYSTEFERAFGVVPENMLALGLGILSHYNGLTREKFDADPSAFLLGPSWFSTIRDEHVRQGVTRIFDYMAFTLDEHVVEMRALAERAPKSLFQFHGMYRHPFVKVDGTTYYPLDMGFAYAQVTDGPYWALLESLSTQGKKKEGDRLRTAFGYAFEWYASEMARPLHSFDPSVHVWLDWDDEILAPEGVSKPDIVMRDGETVYVAEVTAAGVPPSVAAGGNGVELRDWLSRIWLGGDRHAGKMKQLMSAWMGAKEGRIGLKGMDWDGVRHVEPILVSLRPVPQHLAIAGLYRDILFEGGASPDFAEHVTVLSSEEWESMCGIRLDGVRWRDVLGARRQAPWKDQSMGVHLYRAGLLKRPHPRVKGFIDEAMLRMKALLFPDSATARSES